MFAQVPALKEGVADVDYDGEPKTGKKIRINSMWAGLHKDNIRLKPVDRREHARSSPTPEDRVTVELIHRVNIHTAQFRDNSISKPKPVAGPKPCQDADLKASLRKRYCK
jgi:hypothetical protein